MPCGVKGCLNPRFDPCEIALDHFTDDVLLAPVGDKDGYVRERARIGRGAPKWKMRDAEGEQINENVIQRRQIDQQAGEHK